jgi:hypothetical protein
MGISVIGASAAPASPIKSIQRGVTSSATTVTISAVNTSKCLVTSFSNASDGDVNTSVANTGASSGSSSLGWWASGVLFGTGWAARASGAYLANSTQLATTGPTRWEVVEFV